MEFSPTEPVGPRAEWIAGSAQVMLDHAVRTVLPYCFEKTLAENDFKRAVDTINTSLTRITQPEDYEFKAASVLLREASTHYQNTGLIVKLLQDSGMDYPRLHEHALADMRRFTFAKSLPDLVAEGLQTQAYFPLNLLRLAHQERPEGTPSPTASVEHIADQYTAPWFQKLIVTASSASNGTWGPLSDTQESNDHLLLTPWLYELKKSKTPIFRFNRSSEALTFDFTPEFRQEIRDEKIRRNNEARENSFADESWNLGSTDGCPVNRARPGYIKPEDMDAFQTIYNLTPDELRQRKNESAIVFGLNQTADYLRQAMAIVRPQLFKKSSH
jgi:hypothetical protein